MRTFAFHCCAHRVRSFPAVAVVQATSLMLPAPKEKDGCGCSSCFCCHTEVIAIENPLIGKILQNLQMLDKPERQREGLVAFLESLSQRNTVGGNARLEKS